MNKIWEDSSTGVKVNKEYLKKKAENREFLGNRDQPLPKITRLYEEGWERIFGRVPDLQDK